MKKQSFIYVLDLIFTFLVVGALVFVRNKTKYIIDEIQLLGPVVDSAKENMSMLSYETVNRLDSLVDKALLWNQFLLPLFVLVVFLVTQYFIWRNINKVSLKKFLLLSLVPFILFLFLINEFTNFLLNFFAGYEFSWFLFIILIILVVCSSYVCLFYLSNKKGKNIFKKFNWYFLLLVLFVLGYLISFIGFFIYLLVADFSYLFFILLLLFTGLITFGRFRFVSFYK